MSEALMKNDEISQWFSNNLLPHCKCEQQHSGIVKEIKYNVYKQVSEI